MLVNIQRFTLHDGPGLRTEIFLKGCPLRCKWCSNPESWMLQIQPGIYRSKCISIDKCGDCIQMCSAADAIKFYKEKIFAIDRIKCRHCLNCAAVCPSEAIKQWGEWKTVEQCMEVILKDKGYYERSGGGVTVSGGEPMLQGVFVREIFKACKKENVQTCLESTLYAKWEDVDSLLPYTDIIISDIKHMDTGIHKQYTGVNNERILQNLKRISKSRKEIILRIPVIPGVNDYMDNIEATADFITNEMNGNVRTLQLLSFMRLGEEKYESLGIPYEMENLEFDRVEFQDKVEKIAEYFNKKGIHCLVGTKEKK